MKTRPAKKYLKDCQLIEVATQKILKIFDANVVSELSRGANYEGSGVLSGSQAMTICTEEVYTYKPYAHQIAIEGVTYILINVRLRPIYKIGRGYTKTQYEYILELQ